MTAAVRLVTPPATQPVSVAEVKDQVRIDHSDDDAMIAALIGVLLVGYGVEDGNILIASAGVFTVIVGVTTALLDTRELIHKDN